ncbi:M3 family metallopeptidase [Rhizobacter sp. Root404]|uniref:M3 family metallopeptidase n=1 Tax=Rhizobacter sp. Root404 TaxID=1736528 RepID=UPI0006F4741D|nr:M3 family metallopeptidase [Rhizobacter sp. Root404]KQW39072.1 oligopeptidase A [Rhizobacter sp. Root404]
MNPLLSTDGLPRFDAIRPEHITPAMDQLLAAADAALDLATSDATPADYDALSAVLDVATERLGRAWGAIGHLNAVADSPALRDAYNANMPKVVDLYTRMGADQRLFAKYKAVLADPRSAQLPAPRLRALTNALRDFKLSGAELEGAARERYAELQDLQAEIGQKFSEHVLDATDGYAYYASAAEVDGMPDDVLQAARQAAEADGQPGYKLTLQYPRYLPVMQYARDRALRERLYRANTTRASEFGPAALDNGPLIRQLLELRQEEAQLLGYASPADLSLVPKMATSPAQVIGFLEDLGHRARPGALRDLAELRDFARDELGLSELQAWDLAFASQKLKEQRYAFSEQEVKQYFTEPKVLEGLFHIVETVFEVRIRPDTAPVWHPSVRFFRIERDDPGAVDGTPRVVGQFYLDLFARAGKRPGAWMDDVRDRWLRPEGHLQTPVANLICNFAPPVVVDGVARPALLTHDDVTTLFHEFGHGLQLMLTQIDDIGVSGISGVEWDAVELPSQFMENFCWEWDVVKRLTAHVDTGAPLPRALFDRMLAAKNFHSGLETLRQVELSLIDMRLHTDASAPTQVASIVDAVRADIAVLTPPPFSRSLNTFTHVFDGGYAAGYYSYKWAEVLSADAWSAFEEAPDVLDVATGRRLREAVLETGGSRSTLDSFKAFRGREPRIDALLRHQGLD